MKILTMSGLFFLAFAMTQTVYATGKASLQLLQALSQSHTMTAQFKQTIQSEDGTVLQEATGTLSISRPGKFRWEVQKPVKQLIVANGDQVFIYDPDLQQVIERKLQKSVGQTPVLLLTRPQTYLDQSFEIQAMPAKKGESVFQLIPKQEKEVFSKIVLSFEGNAIRSMTLYSQLGQKTRIDFSDVKADGDLDEWLFEFKVPSGTDVVKE